MTRLSILIPSKNEPLLQKTVEDILSKITDDTEILIGMDGYDRSDSNVKQVGDLIKGLQALDVDYSRINIIYEYPAIGQRAITNKLAELAKGEYIMKCDAHVSFSKGFDTALLSEIDNKTILAPLLLVLDPVTWAVNGKKQMAQFRFDNNFVMQHADGDVGETMCLQGSCWMISKENYFKWNVCDETLGSWGGQSVELGIKAYLNGGICKTTRSAYYGHVFRHLNEEFPYDRGDNPGKFATEELKRRYENDPKVIELIAKYSIAK